MVDRKRDEKTLHMFLQEEINLPIDELATFTAQKSVMTERKVLVPPSAYLRIVLR
jgi:hypothetical protein